MDKRTKERFEILAKQAAFHGHMWAPGHEPFTREQVDEAAMLSMDASTRFRRWMGDPEYEQSWKDAFWTGWQERVQDVQNKRSEGNAPLE